jgi:hypothetical protein
MGLRRHYAHHLDTFNSTAAEVAALLEAVEQEEEPADGAGPAPAPGA